MNSEELRYGNYVYGSRNIIVEVRSIQDDEINYEAERIYSGIPITEETILNCGFQQVGFYENVYYKNDFRIYFDKRETLPLLKYEKGSNHLEITVRFVHQLQNLFYVLTGEELPVRF